MVQKYLHDVDAWEALAVEAQEKVIGRTKLTDLELDAPGSHKDINTVLGPDGSEQKILRSAMPFGRPGHGEFGTYFVAYARTPRIPETMLRNMLPSAPFRSAVILQEPNPPPSRLSVPRRTGTPATAGPGARRPPRTPRSSPGPRPTRRPRRPSRRPPSRRCRPR